MDCPSNVTNLRTSDADFRAAQVANAAAALSGLDLDTLPADARAAVELAQKALSASPTHRRMSTDVGIRAQEAAEEHLAACQDALFEEEEGGELTDSPAFGPFCGCETCVIREVLEAAWPVFEADFAVRVLTV